MANLLDMVKDQMSTAVLNKIAGLIGADSGATASALPTLLPGLLSGVIDKGNDRVGAASLLGLINDNDLGGGVLDHIGDILGGGERSTNFMSMGASLLSSIFGANESGIIGSLSNLIGLNKSQSSGFLSILAPIVLSQIGKLVKKDNLDAGGLMSFLQGQKSIVNAALPAGFSALGASHTPTASTTSSTVRTTQDNNNTGGLGILRWLIPLILGLLLVWFLMNQCNKNETVVVPDDNTEMQDDQMDHSTHMHSDGSVHEGTHHEAQANQTEWMYRLDSEGNVVDRYGFIIFPFAQVKRDAHGNIIDPAGQVIIPIDRVDELKVTTVGKVSPVLSIDANGNLVDEKGNIILKKGEFRQEGDYYVDNQGNKIGFFKKLGDAIGNAAEATADAFRDVFGGLFKSKKVGSTQRISKMTFNPENHRLTYFNKNEFEGLVAALKAYPDSKIQIRVYTNDGKDAKENKKLTELRANVVRDMMVTLGIDKNQISFQGMGGDDATKAAGDVVEVYVEK